VAGKEIAVKKYVVRLTSEERDRLEALVHAGKSPAQLSTRARILLKADVSEAREGWSDSAISAALDTSINNVARTRYITRTTLFIGPPSMDGVCKRVGSSGKVD
jgi:hypothetical protein